MATCFNNNPSRVDWRWTKIEMWEGKETHLAQARKFTAIKSIRMIKNTILMIRWTFTILQHTRKWSFLKFIYIFFVILRVMWRIISSYMAWGFVCFEGIFYFDDFNLTTISISVLHLSSLFREIQCSTNQIKSLSWTAKPHTRHWPRSIIG